MYTAFKYVCGYTLTLSLYVLRKRGGEETDGKGIKLEMNCRRDHNVTVFCILLQFPYLQSASCSNSPPPSSHRCHLDQTMWCQLPTSPALWPMRAPSSGSGPFHLGSPSPRCGSLMGPGPALCRYPRFLQPMKETTHAVPASMDSLLRALLSFNSMVAK